jgi:hypothetical protein
MEGVMKGSKAFSATALLLGISAAASATNLVTNGGFETGDLTGWTINPSADLRWEVDTNHAPGLVPNSGSFFVETGCVGSECLTYGGPLANDLSQVLTTVAGQSYTLSFYTSNQTGGAASPSEVNVYWGGTQVVALNPVPGAVPNYTQYTGTVTASGTLTNLEFLGQQDPSYFALDDVSVVTAVPLPASAWLLLSGLGVGGLGLLARRRQRDSLAALAAI